MAACINIPKRKISRDDQNFLVRIFSWVSWINFDLLFERVIRVEFIMNYNVDMTIRRKYKIPVWISVNILIILTVDFNFNYKPTFILVWPGHGSWEKILLQIIASRLSSSFDQVSRKALTGKTIFLYIPDYRNFQTCLKLVRETYPVYICCKLVFAQFKIVSCQWGKILVAWKSTRLG